MPATKYSQLCRYFRGIDDEQRKLDRLFATRSWVSLQTEGVGCKPKLDS